MQHLKAALSSLPAKLLIVPVVIAYETWTDVMPGCLEQVGVTGHLALPWIAGPHLAREQAEYLMATQYLLLAAPYLIDRSWQLRGWAVLAGLASGAVPVAYLSVYLADPVSPDVSLSFFARGAGVLGLAVTLLYIAAYLTPPRARAAATDRPPERAGGSGTIVGSAPSSPGSRMEAPTQGEAAAAAPVRTTAMGRLRRVLTSLPAKVLIVPIAVNHVVETLLPLGHYSMLDTRIRDVASAMLPVTDWHVMSLLLIVFAPYLMNRPRVARVWASVVYLCGAAVPALYLYIYIADGVYELVRRPVLDIVPLVPGLVVTALYVFALLMPSPSDTAAPNGAPR